MKPEAILTAAVELLAEIAADPHPANDVINRYTRARRYIGSKDRRSLTDLVWRYIRHHNRLNYLYPTQSPTERLRLLDQLPPHIDGAPDWVNWEVPEWLPPLIPDAARELPALLGSADTILRVNGDRDTLRNHLHDLGVEAAPTALSPYGLRLKHRTNLQALPPYRDGLLEVQDEASQCVALATGIKAGDSVLDYCAGAGGKSLIFAQMMGNRGTIVAHDTSDKRLAELARRAARARATCIQIRPPQAPEVFTHVVTDVPCSGTGTWRRCPDQRYRLTPTAFQTLLTTQTTILDAAASFVASGGLLSYMTCSLTAPENDGAATAFLTRHPTFSLVFSRQFSPAKTDTDGLYIAQFRRND